MTPLHDDEKEVFVTGEVPHPGWWLVSNRIGTIWIFVDEDMKATHLGFPGKPDDPFLELPEQWEGYSAWSWHWPRNAIKPRIDPRTGIVTGEQGDFKLGAHIDDVAVDALPATEESSAGDLADARHQTKLLAQALGDCILASGIVRSDLDMMSGPQLLMFAEDLKEQLLARRAEVQAEPVAWPKGVAQFTKKPVTISAIQWTGKNLRDVIAFTDGPPDTRTMHAEMAWDDYANLVMHEGLKICTLEGKMLADVGDWIIRGVKGEHYPCKPDIFAATYEPATAPQPATSPVATQGVQAEPVANPGGWREQFSQAVYADLAAADNQDIPLEEYPGRILKVLDSIVGPHHPTVVHWRIGGLDKEAIEELSQLGYTVKDGRLIPPDYVGELMAVVQTSNLRTGEVIHQDAQSIGASDAEMRAVEFGLPTGEPLDNGRVADDAEEVDWVTPRGVLNAEDVKQLDKEGRLPRKRKRKPAVPTEPIETQAELVETQAEPVETAPIDAPAVEFPGL